jgi:hypothetical protein
MKVRHLTVAKLFLLKLEADEEEYASTDGRRPDCLPHQGLEAASQSAVNAPVKEKEVSGRKNSKKLYKSIFFCDCIG